MYVFNLRTILASFAFKKRILTKFCRPFLTNTLAFLDIFVQFVEPCAPRFELEKIADLQTLLSRMVQFGRPIEANYLNVLALNKTDFPANDTSEPRPSWKPVISAVPRVAPRVEIQLVETISAMQYDHPKLVADTWQVHGRMLARVDLEANGSLSVPLNRAAGALELSDVRYHPCVVSPPWTTTPLLTTFQPPLGQITLASYNVSLPRLPIRGFYQLRETPSPHVYKILVQLKLSDFVNNAFEFCEVELPFPTRKEISTFDLIPSTGQVIMHPKKKNSLIWSLGTRFVGRNMEVSLPGSVTFDPAVITEGSEDPFCVLPNAYVDVRFRMPDTSLAGLSLDTRQVTINPKPNGLKGISHERILVSDKYYIWNSNGNVKYCSIPSDEAGTVSHPK